MSTKWKNPWVDVRRPARERHSAAIWPAFKDPANGAEGVSGEAGGPGRAAPHLCFERRTRRAKHLFGKYRAARRCPRSSATRYVACRRKFSPCQEVGNRCIKAIEQSATTRLRTRRLGRPRFWRHLALCEAFSAPVQAANSSDGHSQYSAWRPASQSSIRLANAGSIRRSAARLRLVLRPCSDSRCPLPSQRGILFDFEPNRVTVAIHCNVHTTYWSSIGV